MWGTWAYYLFSPFNLVLLFTPGKWITFGILLITVLKVGCSGWAFSKLLLKEKWQKGFLVPAFSIAYALNGFVVANILNIMWLDALVFLPLMIIGIENLIERKSMWVYPVFLAIILVTNYYMGYMICIFAVLYFAWTYVRSSEKIQAKWKTIGSFIGRSLLGAGMAAVVYYPRSLTSCRPRRNIIPSHSNGNLITHHGKSCRSSWSAGSILTKCQKGRQTSSLGLWY